MGNISDTELALYSRETISKVWKRGFGIHGYNPQMWRYDVLGKPISYREYNNQQSKYGWTIDFIDHTCQGRERFAVENLQPVCIHSLATLHKERGMPPSEPA
jgi:hypothetical protein